MNSVRPDALFSGSPWPQRLAVLYPLQAVLYSLRAIFLGPNFRQFLRRNCPSGKFTLRPTQITYARLEKPWPSWPVVLRIDIDGGEVVDYYANGWWVGEVLGRSIVYARGFNGQYVVVVPDLNLVFVRLGMLENEKSEKNNEYKLTDNLKFITEEVIKKYSF